MKQFNKLWIGAILGLTLISLACRLTSPIPASWSGTPTAAAREATNAVIVLTQQAAVEEDVDLTPILTPTQAIPTPTPQPTVAVDGPWLVFHAPEEGLIQAYDIDAQVTLEIVLPEPIYTSDLVNGLSPDGHTLVVRAGSEYKTDELGLYLIDLPSIEVTKLTPLLSLSVQRNIINDVGTRAFDTFRAVTRDDGLAWSPDGRFLAFTAALDALSSDLLMWDTQNDRIERLNGVYSHSTSPFWAPESNWLISQEMGDYSEKTGWRSEVVSSLRIPSFSDQNTLYLPVSGSQGEVFLGWLNAQSFMSYSQTVDGPQMLRQVNVDTLVVNQIISGSFSQAALDRGTTAYAYTLDDEAAASRDLVAGIYLVKVGSSVPELIRSGVWPTLIWDTGGLFVASGEQGLIGFTSDGQNIFLPDENMARLSPSGNWLVAWGDEEGGNTGARLYQSPSGTRLQDLTDLQVESVFWQPDSKAFFMVAEGTLYRIAFPGLGLEEIATGFTEDHPPALSWIE
jgi:hypothetical protein